MVLSSTAPKGSAPPKRDKVPVQPNLCVIDFGYVPEKKRGKRIARPASAQAMVGAKGKARETYIRRARNIWSKRAEPGSKGETASPLPNFKVLNGSPQSTHRRLRSQPKRKQRKRRASTGSALVQGEDRIIEDGEEASPQVRRRRGRQRRKQLRQQQEREKRELQHRAFYEGVAKNHAEGLPSIQQSNTEGTALTLHHLEAKRGESIPTNSTSRQRTVLASRSSTLSSDSPYMQSRSPKGASPRSPRRSNSERLALARAVLSQLARSGMSPPETIKARAFGAFSSRPLGAPRQGKRGVQQPAASVDLSLSSTSPREQSRRVVQGSPIHAVRRRREQDKLA